MLYQRADSPALLYGHEAARLYLGTYFDSGEPSVEQLVVAHLNGTTHCIHVERYRGLPTAVGLPVRDIVGDALRLGSAGVILAHNHPSGDPRPSEADYRATRKLARAAEVIDLVILDHLIFGARDCSSMRRMGLL